MSTVSAFLPFLPNDDAGDGDLLAAQRLDNEIERLLQLPPEGFWATVCSEPTLMTSIDSFLSFKRQDSHHSQRLHLAACASVFSACDLLLLHTDGCMTAT